MSAFQGRRIEPPTGPHHQLIRSTQEERDFALALHRGDLRGEWRAIARRVTREFGIMRGDSTVRQWIRKAEAVDA